MTDELRRMSYFETLNPHAEWALSLKPGDRVLTNWNSSIFEYVSSGAPWQAEESLEWTEVVIFKTWKDKDCGSGVLVKFEGNNSPVLDSEWIKPIEATNETD